MAISFSRYKNNKYLLNNSSQQYLILRDRIDFEEQENDSFFTVKEEFVNRIDLISNKFYNTPDLWWVILEANNINDPFDIPINTLLRIPDYMYVLKMLRK